MSYNVIFAVPRLLGNVTEKYFIGGFAIVTLTSPIIGTGTLRTYHLHHDHLGSIDAITDENGVVEQRMSFDQFFLPVLLIQKTGTHFLGNTCGQAA